MYSLEIGPTMEYISQKPTPVGHIIHMRKGKFILADASTWEIGTQPSHQMSSRFPVLMGY